tara:strand:- start:293 stop:649 length:357 start_codon:yes stop_codon:yes gene_type:complete
MNFLYKVLNKEEWDSAKSVGYIETELDKQDGYVHLSSAKQLALTLHLYFRELSNVVLLEIDMENIKSKLTFEEDVSGKRSGKFPHLYGKLLITDIANDWNIERKGFSLPEKVLFEAEN